MRINEFKNQELTNEQRTSLIEILSKCVYFTFEPSRGNSVIDIVQTCKLHDLQLEPCETKPEMFTLYLNESMSCLIDPNQIDVDGLRGFIESL